MALGGNCPLEPNKSCPLAPGAESSPCPRTGSKEERKGAHLGVQDLAVPQPAGSFCPKMVRGSQPLSLLLLLILVTTVQGQADTGPKELQPWLIGLTAVVVFLFIVFVLLLANRLWRVRMRRKQNQETPGMSRLERTGRVNPAAEKESDEESDAAGRSKATPL